jgi:hypothetical protein
VHIDKEKYNQMLIEKYKNKILQMDVWVSTDSVDWRKASLSDIENMIFEYGSASDAQSWIRCWKDLKGDE